MGHRKIYRATTILLLMAAAALAGPAGAGETTRPISWPTYFEANRGQVDERVHFVARGSRHTLFLVSNEVVLALGSASILRMRLVGSNPAPDVRGLEELRGRSHYFLGEDPAGWTAGVPHYARVEYREIYPGIDQVLYSNDGLLEYDFVVAPGVDPSVIRLAFSGASRMAIDEKGDLLLETPGGRVVQRAPLAYQLVAGMRRVVASGYARLSDSEIGFEIGPYDPERVLVIDPVLQFSTRLGGSGGEFQLDAGGGIFVDSSGHAYVAGRTQSTDFPTANPYQAANGGNYDFFVAKLTPDGSGLVYSTYLGGSSGDGAHGIVVDAAGNAYVTGMSISEDFPLTGENSCGGCPFRSDILVAKLSPAGTLVYAQHIGSNGDDRGLAIALDGSGNIYVTGTVASGDLATPGAFQTTKSAAGASYVAKVSGPTGALQAFTYLRGADSRDEGHGIAVDAAGNVYVTGLTKSSDFPTTPGAFQECIQNDCLLTGDQPADVFVSVLNPTLSSLLHSTFLGSSSGDDGKAVALDADGNVYLTGAAGFSDFPVTAGAFQETHAGGITEGDAFAAKLDPSLSTLLYSTLLGNSQDEMGEAIGVDKAGMIHVAGWASGTFPTENPIDTNDGDTDAFVARLNPAGGGSTDLLYSTHFGGGNRDEAHAIAVSEGGTAYVLGVTQSPDLDTTAGAFQENVVGSQFNWDAFVLRISPVNIQLTVEPDLLSWLPEMDAAGGYDIVRGDLETLRSTTGDFTAATEECLADNHPTTSLSYAIDPGPGAGFWFLVRDVESGGNGTYESGGVGQVEPRDAEIDLSVNSCP